MATNFSNKMQISKPMIVGNKKQNDMPLDIRTRIETLDEIAKIEYPYVGMMFYVKETDKYYSVKSLKSEELVPGIPSTAIANYRVGEYEEFEADTSTEEDILVSGTNLGGLLEGQVIPAGTTFTEFLKMLLQKPEEFPYEAPQVFISLDPEQMQHEVGSKVSPEINFVFDQKDGGEIVSVEYGPVNNKQQEEVVILDEGNIEYSVMVNFAEGPQKFDDFGEPAGQPLPAGQIKAVCSYSGFRCNFFGADNKQQEEVVILDEGNVEYSVMINFAEGPQKFDDFGEPAGQPLPAGQIKAVCSYSGFRCNFFGADNKQIACGNSEEIRSLNKAIGDSFVLEAPAGSQRLTIAVPANGKQPVSVEYEQQGGAEYISNFNKSIVSVSGATPGENMMDYNVYTFIFLIPCAAKMTFNVLLG